MFVYFIFKYYLRLISLHAKKMYYAFNSAIVLPGLFIEYTALF